MQPEEYLYYLPAYLHYIVSHHEQSGWENDIVNFMIFNLCPSDTTYDYSIFQHSLLAQEQRLVVVAF
ncbi:MAG: hypothetical protein OER96_08740, partial [Gammaproteobacteria bacterium]|nr:hypothetical protein [Gammaproteobacteria bacterium]